MNIPQPIMRNKDQNDKKEKKLKKKRISSENQVTISQSSKLARHVDALYLKFSI